MRWQHVPYYLGPRGAKACGGCVHPLRMVRRQPTMAGTLWHGSGLGDGVGLIDAEAANWTTHRFVLSPATIARRRSTPIRFSSSSHRHSTMSAGTTAPTATATERPRLSTLRRFFG